MNRKQTILKIAYEVREYFENLHREGKIDCCSDLCGACAIVSAELYRRLEDAGIHSYIVQNHNEEYTHVFVVVPHGRTEYIVDVSATQFEFDFMEFDDVMIPRVLMATRRQLEKLCSRIDDFFWSEGACYTDADDFRLVQIEMGWPEEQLAFTKMVTK